MQENSNNTFFNKFFCFFKQICCCTCCCNKEKVHPFTPMLVNPPHPPPLPDASEIQHIQSSDDGLALLSNDNDTTASPQSPIAVPPEEIQYLMQHGVDIYNK